MTRWSWLPATALLAVACGTPAPRPVAWGRDICDRCHMVITDPRFAAELVTAHGKVYTFDDIGGLVLWYRDSGLEAGGVAGVWVYDSRTPEVMLSADSAVFVRSPVIHTPMASGLVAVASRRAADSLMAETGGTVLTWPQVLDLPDLRDRPERPDLED